MAVEFTLAGQRFVGINGGPQFTFTEALSFKVDSGDQVELDRYWNALTADGGKPVQCGWLDDKFTLSWQITPAALLRALPASCRRCSAAW